VNSSSVRCGIGLFNLFAALGSHQTLCSVYCFSFCFTSRYWCPLYHTPEVCEQQPAWQQLIISRRLWSMLSSVQLCRPRGVAWGGGINQYQIGEALLLPHTTHSRKGRSKGCEVTHHWLLSERKGEPKFILIWSQFISLCVTKANGFDLNYKSNWHSISCELRKVIAGIISLQIIQNWSFQIVILLKVV
jgi:hypothetical protein